MSILRRVKNKIVEHFPVEGISGTKAFMNDPDYHCHVGYYDFDPINTRNQIVYHKTRIKVCQASDTRKI